MLRLPSSRSISGSAVLLAGTLASAALVLLTADHSPAQQKTQRQAGATQGTAPRAPAASAPATKAATKAAGTTTKPAPPKRERVDTLAQQQFLATEEWKTTASDFDQWLNSQVFYDEARTNETRARFAVGVDRMSAEQLQRFMVGMQEKLALLYSDLAKEAEDYFLQKSAVASEAYMKRIRDQIPDILTATPAQINQKLMTYSARRQGRRETQDRFDESRQARLSANQARIQARQDAQQRAVERRGRSPAVGPKENDFTPARDYAPHNQPQSGFGVPMFGFPMGGGIIW